MIINLYSSNVLYMAKWIHAKIATIAIDNIRIAILLGISFEYLRYSSDAATQTSNGAIITTPDHATRQAHAKVINKCNTKRLVLMLSPMKSQISGGS